MHLTGGIADGLGSLQLAQTQGTAKTAANLGLNVNMRGRWKREQPASVPARRCVLGTRRCCLVSKKREYETQTVQGKSVFTGRGVPALTEQEKEIKQLRKELEIARQERGILKKAVTFFARAWSEPV